MQTGQTMYRGVVKYGIIENAVRPFYMDTATATSAEMDGKPLVRFVDLLMSSEGWHTTEAAAKQEVVDKLVRYIGTMQAVVDRLRDEIVHDVLTTEEVAA